MTWRETYEKWLNSPALSEEEWKELDAIRDDPKEIEDRFYAPLVFGTAGLRGIMGLGTNRMNIHVIRHATQAFAELIAAEGAGSDEARRVRLPRLPQQRRGVCPRSRRDHGRERRACAHFLNLCGPRRS